MPRSTSKKTTTTRKKKSRAPLFGSIVAVGLVLTVVAIIFGRSDDGEINVTDVINNSNIAAQESIANGESPAVPVIDSRPKQLNGGLVGSGREVEPEPVPEPDTASTTEEMASSTDEVFEESETEETDVGSTEDEISDEDTSAEEGE